MAGALAGYVDGLEGRVRTLAEILPPGDEPPAA
jgi:hypothetical protein